MNAEVRQLVKAAAEMRLLGIHPQAITAVIENEQLVSDAERRLTQAARSLIKQGASVIDLIPLITLDPPSRTPHPAEAVIERMTALASDPEDDDSAERRIQDALQDAATETAVLLRCGPDLRFTISESGGITAETRHDRRRWMPTALNHQTRQQLAKALTLMLADEPAHIRNIIENRQSNPTRR